MPTLPTQLSFAVDDAFPPTTPGQLRLYSMRFCPFAQRSRIVLAHKDIDFEVVNVNLKSRPDWFYARNPGGMVPVAEIDDKVIYESTAVSEWLDEVYPKNKLTPTDPYQKALDRILLENFGKVTSNLYKTMNPDDRKKALEDIKAPLKGYEETLAKRGTKYFGGDSMAMIDVYLWPHFNMFIQGVLIPNNIDLLPKEEFPLLREWYNTMRETPSVKSTTMTDDGYANFLKTYVTGKPDYDYKL